MIAYLYMPGCTNIPIPYLGDVIIMSELFRLFQMVTLKCAGPLIVIEYRSN